MAGWRVESVTPSQAVMVNGRGPHHILHLLLSVFTAGLWLPVWLIIALSAREVRAVVTAHPDGHSWRASIASKARTPWYQNTRTVVLVVLGVLAVLVLVGSGL